MKREERAQHISNQDVQTTDEDQANSMASALFDLPVSEEQAEQATGGSTANTYRGLTTINEGSLIH